MTTASSPKSEIKAYQLVLQRAGCYWGDIDGQWGPKTQRAHEQLEAQKQPASGSGSVRDIVKGIVATAERFVDLTESESNARWDELTKDKSKEARGSLLRAELIATGWQSGWAYCMAFGEVCWRGGYKGRPELALIGQAITPSVMGTFENFQELKRISQTPTVGSLMLFQHGSTWQGHASVVIETAGDSCITIEGNTSPGVVSDGRDREGDGVWRKSRRVDFTKKAKGLWLRGFVNPFTV